MSENYGAAAMIIAKRSVLRDGLRALVMAMPQLKAVHEADDLTSALKLSEPQPALVMLDLPARRNGEDAWLTVRRAKARWPQARCIFLANDVQQQQEAESAGADVVLLEGFPPEKLVAAIVKLLPCPVV